MSTTPERQPADYVADIKELQEGDVVPLGNRRFQLKQIPAESAPYARWAFRVGDSPSCTTLHRGGILEVNGYLQEYVTYQMRGHADSDVKFWIVSEPPGGRPTKSTELTLKLGSVEGAQQQPLPLPLEPIREQVQGTLAAAPDQLEYDPSDLSSAVFLRTPPPDPKHEGFILPPPPAGMHWIYHITGPEGKLYTPIDPSQRTLSIAKRLRPCSVFLRLEDAEGNRSQAKRELTIDALEPEEEFLLTPLEEAKDEPASGEIPDSGFDFLGELPDSVQLEDSSLDLGPGNLPRRGGDDAIDLDEPWSPGPEDSDLNLGADSGLSLGEPERPEPAAPGESGLSQEEADALLDQVTTELDGRHFVIHAPAPPAGYRWSIAVIDDPEHRSNVRFITPSGQQGRPFEYQLIMQEEPREVTVGLSTNGVPRFSRQFPMPAAPDIWEKLLATPGDSASQEPSDASSPDASVPAPDEGTTGVFGTPLEGALHTQPPAEQVTDRVDAVRASVGKALAIINGEDTWTNFDSALKEIPEQLKVFFVPEAAIYDLDLAGQQSLRETAASLKRLLGCVWPGETPRTYDTKSAKVSRTMRAIAKSVGYVAFGTKQSPHAEVEHPHPMRKSIEAVYDRIAGAITRRKRRAFLAHSARMIGTGIAATIAAQTGYKIWSGVGAQPEDSRGKQTIPLEKAAPIQETGSGEVQKEKSNKVETLQEEKKQSQAKPEAAEAAPKHMSEQEILAETKVSVKAGKDVRITLPSNATEYIFGKNVRIFVGIEGEKMLTVNTSNGLFSIPPGMLSTRNGKKISCVIRLTNASGQSFDEEILLIE